jgi:hypothetical protein
MSAGNGMASLPAHPPFLPGGFFFIGCADSFALQQTIARLQTHLMRSPAATGFQKAGSWRSIRGGP